MLSVAEPFARALRSLPASVKTIVMVMVDGAVVIIAMLMARALRIPDAILPPHGTLHLHLIGPVASIVSMALFGLYQSASRGHSMRIEQRIVLAQLAATVFWVGYLQLFELKSFPRSIPGIFLAMAAVGLVIERRFATYVLAPKKQLLPRRERLPVFIYGTGTDAMRLIESLENHGHFRPVALFDSDTTVIGRKLQNLRVHDIAALADLVQETGTRQVLIAEPGLSRAVRRTLLEKFTEQAVTVKIAPAANEIADGTYLPSSIRDIKIEDLLGRDPVPPQEALVHKSVAQKSVMITGAGGSIGSELSLQCLRGGATTLVLLDHSEFALFEIQREIEAEISGREDVRVIAALEDVNSTDALRVLMRHYRVDVIFHAAAYKHVRMLQENPEVGIRNNIEGTRSVAQAAVDCGVSSFVLISTDKAVRPTSVMGATKRVSEMIVQSLSDLPYCKTLFCMVRFGNVLGSTGSVVPIFRDQIAKGGPVTVTHPDVTRYFMLIPEAAQLVVQAASIAKSGEVLVLDMGEPVRVSQLAHAMVELAGSTVKSNENPDGDIEIKYIGLREGEKMHEELEIGNDLTPTLHPRILRSKEFKLPRAKLDAQLKLLNGMLNKHQRQKAIALLMELAFKH